MQTQRKLAWPLSKTDTQANTEKISMAPCSAHHPDQVLPLCEAVVHYEIQGRVTTNLESLDTQLEYIEKRFRNS